MPGISEEIPSEKDLLVMGNWNKTPSPPVKDIIGN
jgi:hypothetical protein